MFQFRHFRNYDPPQLLQLWNECGLGRGAAGQFTCDALDYLIFSTQYFDPRGLIVATQGTRIIGAVHAAFGTNADGSGVELEAGVICLVLVHPAYRRRGIGTELVRRAESYLYNAGTRSIQAGPAAPRDPYYFGLYGGSEPAGFLESDPLANPFFLSMGYSEAERHLIFQKQLSDRNEPVDMRLIQNRRSLQFSLTDEPSMLSPWWVQRYGKLEPVRFLEVSKRGGGTVAEVSCYGLDLFCSKWQGRPAALANLFVMEDQRRQGFGKTLLLDVFRRLREETLTMVELHVSATNEAGVRLLNSVGCQQVDTGVVYQKSLTESPILSDDLLDGHSSESTIIVVPPEFRR